MQGSPPAGPTRVLDADQGPGGLEAARVALSPVLKSGDEIDMLELGRIEQSHRCGRSLSCKERAAWEWLAASGGARVLARASDIYADHLKEHVRQHGGTITTVRHGWKNGRRTVTKRVRHFAVRPHGRSVPRMRGAGRPAGRRRRATRASSFGDDPHQAEGGDDPPRPSGALEAFLALSEAEQEAVWDAIAAEAAAQHERDRVAP